MIKSIKENPYRVLGILACTKQKAITKQNSKINALLNVGKKIEFQDDFNFGDLPTRNPDDISRANAEIQLNSNKLKHALFWFINQNHLDKIAFEYLVEGNLYKAEEIWQKVIDGKEVSLSNYSSFNNLGTLKFFYAVNDDQINYDELGNGLNLKLKLIDSDAFSEFSKTVTDNNYALDHENELKLFIDVLIEGLFKAVKSNSDKRRQLIAQLCRTNPKVKDVIKEKFTDPTIKTIERSLKNTKTQRVDHPENGLALAKQLYRNTKDDLKLLELLYKKDELKYILISDKVAKELLQCGIDFYNESRNHEDDISIGDCEAVLDLFETTKVIAQSKQVLDRIDESHNAIQGWIDQEPERKKQDLVNQELEFIATKINRFKSLNDTFTNCSDLISSCKPKLDRIKQTLGAYDELYLNISSAVASNVQGMMVAIVNNAMDKRTKYVEYVNYLNNPMGYKSTRSSFGQETLPEILDNTMFSHLPKIPPYAPEYSLSSLKSVIREALELTKKLGTLDMLPEQRQHFVKNKEGITNIANQLNIIEGSSTFASSSRSYSGSQSTSSRPVSGGGQYTKQSEDLSWIWWVLGFFFFLIAIATCVD